ncbi:DcuS/MalK family sensor histidine kinase [Paenibacillus wynnii]|uniref:DcuS/MalK family sensor histidine kinase n=1 Tax=Paenibacillus wynnii TaxID=268407 RepID=UPI0027933FBF|nr:DcuS/MalK family sensor histidine kinase [Paenibacillus wynnii]MDQ0191939.1 two-component system sensor histidine kinase DcuS [Paenibacillus wynnii]
MFKRKRIYGVRTSITIMVCSVVTLVLLLLYVIFRNQIIPQTRQNLEDKAITIARTIAMMPLISDGLIQGRSEEIQAYTTRITRRNDIMFVVVIDMNSIRYSHPDASYVGKPFAGGGQDIALHGEESVSEGEGTLGKSIRAFVPVYDGRGHQVGIVVVGLSLEKVHRIISRNEWTIIAILLSGALLGALGAMVLARRIKQMMLWLEPSEISKLLEERSAMLQSTREGILAIDDNAKVTLINLEAERLLRQAGIKGAALRQPVSEYWPALRLENMLNSGIAKLDEEIDLNGTTLLANSLPIWVNGAIVGAIVTFRDKTEISHLAERLSGVSLYAEALRGQAHEFMNKLHVIMGMTHMGLYEELQHYISGTVNNYQNEIGSITRHIKDPVMAGFLLGKLSRAREAGIQLILAEDCYLPRAKGSEIIHELITIVGNLLDNAMDALEETDNKEIHLAFHYHSDRLTCTVIDNGLGVPEYIRKEIYEQGFSTKGENRGMGLYLVQRSVNRMNGHLTLHTTEGHGSEFIVEVPYIVEDDDA